jgi:DNA-binding transcriptional MerR regulator
MSGVTRTLHHYEAIGLLVPSGRSRAGYRLYVDADLLRLQQILIRRELGFPLEDIREALDDVSYDHREALLSQRRDLEAQARATARKLQAIDAALAALNTDEGTDTVSMQSIFDGFDPSSLGTRWKPNSDGATPTSMRSRPGGRRRTRPRNGRSARPNRIQSIATWRSPCRMVLRPIIRASEPSPSGTVCRSIAGSIRAMRRCTPVSLISTRPTPDLQRTSIGLVLGSRHISRRRSGRMLPKPSASGAITDADSGSSRPSAKAGGRFAFSGLAIAVGIGGRLRRRHRRSADKARYFD